MISFVSAILLIIHSRMMEKFLQTEIIDKNKPPNAENEDPELYKAQHVFSYETFNFMVSQFEDEDIPDFDEIPEAEDEEGKMEVELNVEDDLEQKII